MVKRKYRRLLWLNVIINVCFSVKNEVYIIETYNYNILKNN